MLLRSCWCINSSRIRQDFQSWSTATEQRNHIVDSVFGPCGLTRADDEIVYEHRLEQTREIIRNSCPEFLGYFTDHIDKHLANNLRTQRRHPEMNGLTTWTNNNCESFNHILKTLVNWRPQGLVDLVLKLEEYVTSQTKELERSLAGVGEFVLCDEYRRFAVPIDVWCNKDAATRQCHFRRLMRSIKQTDGII